MSFKINKAIEEKFRVFHKEMIDSDINSKAVNESEKAFQTT